MQNTVVAVAVEATCAVAYINLAFYLAYRRPVNHAETLAFTIFRFRVNWLAMASNSPQTWYLPGMRSRLLALFWLYACRSLYRAELLMQTSIFFIQPRTSIFGDNRPRRSSMSNCFDIDTMEKPHASTWNEIQMVTKIDHYVYYIPSATNKISYMTQAQLFGLYRCPKLTMMPIYSPERPW